MIRHSLEIGSDTISMVSWRSRAWRFAQGEWFALTTLCAVFLAYCFPWLGDKKGPLPVDLILNSLIALLLFLTGLKLPSDELLKGATSWRVHVIVQFILIVLNPLVIWTIFSVSFLRELFSPEILNGILLTQAMATTTSTCVIFTASAGGNEAAAIFNATLSNGLGIFTGPFLAWLLLSKDGGASSGTTRSVLEKLAFIILLPFFVAQLVRYVLTQTKELGRIPKRLDDVMKVVLITVEFSVFCSYFGGGGYGVSNSTLAGIVFTLTLLHGFTWVLCIVVTHPPQFKLSRRDRACVFFCATERSIVTGIPMIVALFPDAGGSKDLQGLYSLPLMIYHMVLLIFAAFLLTHVKKWVDIETKSSLDDSKIELSAPKLSSLVSADAAKTV